MAFRARKAPPHTYTQDRNAEEYQNSEETDNIDAMHHCKIMKLLLFALLLYCSYLPSANGIAIMDRRQTLQNLMVASATTVMHPKEKINASNYYLDSIDWKEPKSYGLNTERMCDGINDSIRETSWLLTGLGSPAYFSNDFLYHSDEHDNNVQIEGYETYCRWGNKRYSNEKNKPECDLICCSVTAKSTITALWRLGYANGLDETRSKVFISTFTTSDDQDGLVVAQYDTVLIEGNAPSGDELRAKCNWYSCIPETLI